MLPGLLCVNVAFANCIWGGKGELWPFPSLRLKMMCFTSIYSALRGKIKEQFELKKERGRETLCFVVTVFPVSFVASGFFVPPICRSDE